MLTPSRPHASFARVSIRPGSTSDADAVAALVNRAFEVEAFFIERPRTNPAEIASMCGRGVFLLAEQDGALAGCVFVETRGERGYFGLLSVDPTRQGQGIGGRLVAAAENHCRRAGCRAMDIRVVNLRKELPPYYRGRGYRETGREPFPEDEPTKLPCEFVVMSKPL
jgi:GNAT superfamily N-acetyltransferase